MQSRHRPAHARRTAAQFADFLLPHLRPGMRVLDIGTGPGSIAAGLADVVGPGLVTGVDLWPMADARVPVAGADAVLLPFADATFDAVYSCAVLQHTPDPSAVLREARRVCRPGAVIGVIDVDHDFSVVHPSPPLLERGREITDLMRAHTSPRVGKQLRGLLHDAGFERAAVTVSASATTTDEAIAQAGAFNAAFFTTPETVARAVAEGWSTEEEMAAIADAWRAWGADPRSFSASAWFRALAWA
jgi:SAM-dependent methyltransferase